MKPSPSKIHLPSEENKMSRFSSLILSWEIKHITKYPLSIYFFQLPLLEIIPCLINVPWSCALQLMKNALEQLQFLNVYFRGIA